MRWFDGNIGALVMSMLMQTQMNMQASAAQAQGQGRARKGKEGQGKRTAAQKRGGSMRQERCRWQLPAAWHLAWHLGMALGTADGQMLTGVTGVQRTRRAAITADSRFTGPPPPPHLTSPLLPSPAPPLQGCPCRLDCLAAAANSNSSPVPCPQNTPIGNLFFTNPSITSKHYTITCEMPFQAKQVQQLPKIDPAGLLFLSTPGPGRYHLLLLQTHLTLV